MKKNAFTPLMNKIRNESFEKIIDGKSVKLFTLLNEKIGLKITNYGARVIGLCVSDKNDNPTDVVIGYKTLEDYLKSNEKYFGCVIGRCANRIRGAEFTMDDTNYVLAQNKGNDHLHGGIKGFGDVVWDGKQVDNSKIIFRYLSKDMEEGYPGNLNITMTYEITDECEFKISYEAVTDKTTICNLTHHSFFNLSGEESETINDHILQINAKNITVVDETVVTTGEIQNVKNTPLDFTLPVRIGDRVNENYEQLIFANGYDHNWMLDKTKKEFSLAATVCSNKSGIQMDVLTNHPGIQFYGGNYLNGTDKCKYGKPITHRKAFALETQGFPNSPNISKFPSVYLKPDEIYKYKTVYKFSKQI